ncbi:RYK [Lepeophtheirus salmonis]|uniref:RYK n=1 Tax=Lepeophtheirus salmonis TaxID=72036 RepID=A0A7R8CJQ3_LEPSM|nr:RYK [Lepeophtheirus salmonis]CAF2843002.1 RYK [Lepeophtheirus salmonis]
MQKFIIMWTSEIHFWMAYALMSFNNLELVGCNFDFYIDSHQTKLLYGLDFREIYFIRNGVINQNAITFLNEEIPTYVDRLIFHWHLSQSRTSTSYHMQVIHLPGPIMRTPILNISSNGFLSFEDTIFSIELPCTGRVRDHVDIMIKMTFISKLLDEYNQSIEPLSLNFKRRKLCAKSSNYMMDGSKANENDDLEYPEQRLSPVASTCIAFGSVLTTIIFLFVLLGFLYVTRKKRHPNIPLNSLVHLDYIPHQNFPTNGYKCYSTPDSFSRLSMEKLCSMKETGYQGSPLNSCSKSFFPSLSKDESSSLSNISPSVPRSLVIEDGVLRLSSSSGYPPPTANKIQNISSCSSSYSSSISLNPQLHDQQPKIHRILSLDSKFKHG